MSLICQTRVVPPTALLCYPTGVLHATDHRSPWSNHP